MKIRVDLFKIYIVSSMVARAGLVFVEFKDYSSQSIAICKSQTNPGADNTFCFGERGLGVESLGGPKFFNLQILILPN